LDSDAGSEAAFRPSSPAQEKMPHRTSGGWPILCVLCKGWAASRLATPLLRLQRLERAQARGKAALHASESGEGGAGAGTGRLGMEQLSQLCVSRRGQGEDQSVAQSGDEDPDTGIVAGDLMPGRVAHPLRLLQRGGFSMWVLDC